MRIEVGGFQSLAVRVFTSESSCRLARQRFLGVLQADAQIYNKVLALIEDWADAINLPAYRQEYNSLKVQDTVICCIAVLFCSA